MRRNGQTKWLLLVITAVALSLVAATPTTLAARDPLVGTWHERDGGRSNIFYFVDAPIGGVYHVLYYDDQTGETVCGDNGPMLWTGFGEMIAPNTLEGNFGNYWCPDNGDGVKTELLPLAPVPFTLAYRPDTDTITGLGECVGTRQPNIKTVERAIQELAKGKYPPSGVFIPCN